MLNALKRWIAGGPPGPDWSGVSGWAERHGHGFKRARDDEGFVIDGSFGSKSWRLEWGPPQRAYITTHELRLRMELKLSSSLQMLVISRPLMEVLERETFERYTEGNQTVIDVSTPEEMRWLAMFPKANPDVSKTLRAKFGAVAADPNTVIAWLDGPFTQQLELASQALLSEDPPFVLMTLRGRIYLRLQVDLPEAATIDQSVALFEAAAQAAQRVGSRAPREPAGEWPTTASTAWQTEPAPEDPKDRRS